MAMNDMFADILKKAIPPEVMALLTKEKIEEFVAQIRTAAEKLNQRLSAIEETQTKILEYMENDNRNSNRKPKRAGNTSDTNGSSSSGSD